MDEAEQLCDRLAVMDARQHRGRRLAARADRGARHARGAGAAVSDPTPTPRLPSAYGQPALGERIEVLPDRVVVYADDGEAALARGARRWRSTPITALVRRATLEDVFLKLTGRSLID